MKNLQHVSFWIEEIKVQMLILKFYKVSEVCQKSYNTSDFELFFS